MFVVAVELIAYGKIPSDNHSVTKSQTISCKYGFQLSVIPQFIPTISCHAAIHLVLYFTNYGFLSNRFLAAIRTHPPLLPPPNATSFFHIIPSTNSNVPHHLYHPPTQTFDTFMPPALLTRPSSPSVCPITCFFSTYVSYIILKSTRRKVCYHQLLRKITRCGVRADFSIPAAVNSIESIILVAWHFPFY